MSAAGQRTERVTLESPIRVPDGEGGTVDTWAPLDPPELYAHINRATARDLERSAGGAVLATASHVIEVPYHPQVTVHTRIVHGARIFQVTAVRDPDEAHRDLVIVAEELLA